MNVFKNLPLVGQLIVTVVLMGIIGFVGFSVFPNIQDQQRNIANKNKRLDDLRQEVDKGRILEKKLPELKREIANLQEQLNQLKAIIPPQRYDSEIVNKFESLAKRSRLVINAISPRKTLRKDFYDEYPLEVDVLANYHDLAKFFDRMAQMPRIFNVKGVKLTQNIGRSTTILAKFTAVTFIYREESENASAGADGKGGKKPPVKKGEAKPAEKKK